MARRTPPTLDAFVTALGTDPRVVHIERSPERSARFATLAEPLPEIIRDLVPERGLWSHQAEAIDHARTGRSVAIATGTASGKSLCFQLPIAEAIAAGPLPATALLLFPTKALAQDQLRSLTALNVPGLIAATHDGDSSPEERKWTRAHANVLLTNPEMLHMSTDSSRLSVVARKSLTDQIAAFTAPPAVAPDAVMAARIHETLANNAAEITLGGRTITQQFVEEQIKKNNAKLPEALGNDPDQPPWSITFAKRNPVELDADDSRVKFTVRGSRFTSGDREFPAMDIWAAYRVEPGPGTVRLVRDGDVQIYPPGFVPGGAEKLTVAETSLRRILQKRFNKVFKEVVDVEPLKLPGELQSAGPLPMEQLVAQKDGWVAVGWRKKDPVVSSSEPTLAWIE